MRRARGVVAGLLVLALLWAQGLGLWHRLAHDHRAAVAAGPAAVVAAAAAPFGHDADDLAACQVFDHLALADLLSFAAPVLPPAGVAESLEPAIVDGHCPARPGHYRARGPPAA